MKNSGFIDTVMEILHKEVQQYKVPVVDLIGVQTKDPYKILVSTILSARTKDETTAKAASRLFKKAPNLQSLAKLTKEEIGQLIFPVGFYNIKAAHLKKLPEALKAFGSKVPDDLDGLLTLPGVGRKTANLVLSVAFNKPAICVDTHVHRIMNIWGYVQTGTPFETEMVLRDELPHNHWQRINSILVAFGQKICLPVAPCCDICVIEHLCPQIGVTPRKIGKKRKAMYGKNTKTIISWNVNGLRALEKKGFAETAKELDADILALQEIKAAPAQLSESIKNLTGYTSFWNSASRKGYAGVCIYSRIEPRNVLYGLGLDQYDQEGRVLTLEFEDFFLINAYFPNAQHGLTRLDYKLDFNRDLLAFANNLAKEKSVVLGGDFNVAHKSIDLRNPKENEKNPGFTAEERAWMDSFLQAGFLDTFRMFNQDPDNYTWWSYRFNARARNIGWRIDYFCVDKKSENRVVDASILKDILGSDHCPVQLFFK